MLFVQASIALIIHRDPVRVIRTFGKSGPITGFEVIKGLNAPDRSQGKVSGNH